MDIVFLLTTITFFLWIIRSTLFWVAVWQRSDYRLSEYLQYGKRFPIKTNPFFYFSYLKWILIIGYVYISFNDQYLQTYQWLVAAIFFLQALLVLREFITGTQLLPEVTNRSVFLITITLVIIYLLFPLSLLIDRFVWMVLLDRIAPLLIAFGVFLLSFPSEIYYDYQIEQTIKKRTQHPELQIILVVGAGIGITEHLALLMKDTGKTKIVYASVMRSYQLASQINLAIVKQTRILVVEVNSLRPQEMYHMQQLLQPSAIIFAAIQQPVDQIIDWTKALPPLVTVLFNGNDKALYHIYRRVYHGTLPKRKFVYKIFPRGTEAKKARPYLSQVDMSITNISVRKEILSCTVSLSTDRVTFTLPRRDAYDLSSLLPALFIAYQKGVSLSESNELLAATSL